MEQISLLTMEYIQSILPNSMEENGILSIVAWVQSLKIHFPFLYYTLVDFIHCSNITYPKFRLRETMEPNLYSQAA